MSFSASKLHWLIILMGTLLIVNALAACSGGDDTDRATDPGDPPPGSVSPDEDKTGNAIGPGDPPPQPGLFDAIWHRDIEEARRSIESGADVNLEHPEWGSPLSLATGMRSSRADESDWEEQIRIVELLVASGSNVHYEDIEGNTPLVQAIYSGQPEMVEVLVIAGADVNAETAYHGSLLNAAVTVLDDIEPDDQTAIVAMLVDAGADANWKRSYLGPPLGAKAYRFANFSLGGFCIGIGEVIGNLGSPSLKPI